MLVQYDDGPFFRVYVYIFITTPCVLLCLYVCFCMRRASARRVFHALCTHVCGGRIGGGGGGVVFGCCGVGFELMRFGKLCSTIKSLSEFAPESATCVSVDTPTERERIVSGKGASRDDGLTGRSCMEAGATARTPRGLLRSFRSRTNTHNTGCGCVRACVSVFTVFFVLCRVSPVCALFFNSLYVYRLLGR